MSRKPKHPPPRFPLGAEVVTKHHAVRRYVPSPSHRSKHEWKSQELSSPLHGIVTGVRFVQDGEVRYHGEDGSSWHATGAHQVYLVTCNLYRIPVQVFAADLMSHEEYVGSLLRLPAST